MTSSSHYAAMKLCLRLYADRDADLLAWLTALDDLPFGGKAEAVKTALRRGVGTPDMVNPAVSTDLLVQVRAVVEAAVTSALANARLAVAPLEAEAPADETEAMLDAFAENLTL